MTKELLTIEFRYYDSPKNSYSGVHKTKIVTIGVFDNLDEAINQGNLQLEILSKRFDVRFDDKFKLKGFFGNPNKLVTNTCYPTNNIQYFAKIETLHFLDLDEVINETFLSVERYKKYLKENN
jgi:hypothetical protein